MGLPIHQDAKVGPASINYEPPNCKSYLSG